MTKDKFTCDQVHFSVNNITLMPGECSGLVVRAADSGVRGLGSILTGVAMLCP